MRQHSANASTCHLAVAVPIDDGLVVAATSASFLNASGCGSDHAPLELLPLNGEARWPPSSLALSSMTELQPGAPPVQFILVGEARDIISTGSSALWAGLHDGVAAQHTFYPVHPRA